MGLTHRERVLMSFNHQQPDRTPVDMMGNASMLLDLTYLRLRDYLGLSPIPPIRSGTSANYYDERILELLGIDFRRIFLKKGPANITKFLEDGTFYDAWQVRYRQEGPFVTAIEHPFANFTTVDEVDAFPWPNAAEMFSTEGVAETAKQMYETTDYALVARNPITAGFLDRSCYLMGMANFFLTLADKPDVAEAMIAHQLEFNFAVYSNFLDALGPYVEVVEVADDLAGQENLLISPSMYRRFIKPAEKKLYGMIHEKAPRAKIVHHSDGAMWKILPDFIEIGVNICNPVQTSAKDMEGYRLKQTYGSQLIFHGGIEKMELSKDELVAEVKERIDQLAPNGGYVVASCNHMIDVPAENIMAMFETAVTYQPKAR